jgi:hypothetical protein
MERQEPMSYKEWFDRFVEEWRRKHPNPGIPSDFVLWFFYERYLEEFKERNNL